MIRGPNPMGPPELSLNTGPASAARLLVAQATDTRMGPVLHARIRDAWMFLPVCRRDRPGPAARGCFPGGRQGRGVLLCSLQSARVCLEGQCHRNAELLMPRVQWQEPGLIC